MSPKFFWFLPTTGDSRSIVGGSHASSNRDIPSGYRAPSRRYLAEVARAADRLGVGGGVAHLGGAAGRDREAEIPGRVPPRAGATHAGRAADRDAATILRRPGAAQR